MKDDKELEKEDKCKCKLYHTTKKSIYENIIKKEGLKYICEKEKKTLQCENGIYFKLSKNNAIDFGHDSFFDKEASKYLESSLYERQITDDEYNENGKKIDKSMNEFFQNCSCTKQ